MSFLYLNSEEIIKIHDLIIAETGGRDGLLHETKLLSLEAQPSQEISGHILYPGIESKSALYLREIIQGHIFVDGNKRTGLTVTKKFLEDNGYVLKAPDKELKEIPLSIAKSELEFKDITNWISVRIKKASIFHRIK